MKKIYEYKLRLDEYQVVKMPEDAEYLTAQVQHGQIVFWAIVDPETPIESRRIRIYSTGTPLDENVDFAERWHIGTVQMGSFVCHVFDEGAVE